MYVLVFLAPMMHWQFQLARFSSVLDKYPGILTFFAPMVDVWAVVLLVAFGISLLRTWAHGDKIHIRMPGIGIYGLFLASALVSLFHVFPWEVVSSFKYIIRFPLFVYIGYVTLGTNILTTKVLLHRAMNVFLFSVTLGALMGLASLFLHVWGLAGLMRAVPFAIFGWAPFGDQHIFLAELFVVTIPMAIYLGVVAERVTVRNLYFGLACMHVLVCLLTFSRAGWLTLFVQTIAFLIIMRKKIPWKDAIHTYIWWGIAALIPFSVYMFHFLGTKVVSMSDAARLALTDISWYLFRHSPFIGQGVGTFVDRVSEIQFFVYEFGTPIDAHSILDKVAAEQGILGIVTFGLFVYWLLLQLYTRAMNTAYIREAKYISMMSLFVVGGALFFQLFSTQYYSAKVWVPIMFALAQLILYKGEIVSQTTSNFFQKKKKSIDTQI